MPTAMILLVLPGRGDHRLALGDVVADRLLDVDVLAGQNGVDRGQGMPVVGRGDDDRVEVLAVEHRPIVAGGLGRIALLLLDPLGRFAGMTVVDVGDGDELRLRSEAGTSREAVLPGSPRRSMPSRTLSLAGGPLRMAGAASKDAAPAETPTASTKPRRVIPSLAMAFNLSRNGESLSGDAPNAPAFLDIDRTGEPCFMPGAGAVEAPFELPGGEPPARRDAAPRSLFDQSGHRDVRPANPGEEQDDRLRVLQLHELSSVRLLDRLDPEGRVQLGRLGIAVEERDVQQPTAGEGRPSGRLRRDEQGLRPDDVLAQDRVFKSQVWVLEERWWKTWRQRGRSKGCQIGRRW